MPIPPETEVRVLVPIVVSTRGLYCGEKCLSFLPGAVPSGATVCLWVTGSRLLHAHTMEPGCYLRHPACLAATKKPSP
jgi:hypothetical protein